MKQIHGVQFILNGNKFDYCYKESIESMCAACDKVHVLDVGSDDGTQEVIANLPFDNLYFYTLHDNLELWNAIQGHTKLSYFQNMVMAKAEQAGADYIFLHRSSQTAADAQ